MLASVIENAKSVKKNKFYNGELINNFCGNYLKKCIKIPLFQLKGFLTKPLGLTRKGSCWVKAASPTAEHLGPSKYIRLMSKNHIN
jgi:hypothetical protein